MSLVAKYARRNEDEDESANTPTTSLMEVTEAPKKKREAENEVEAPPAKRPKAESQESEKLELPDFFKTEPLETASLIATEPKQGPVKSSQPNMLVPRQLRGISPNIVTDEELAAKLKKNQKK